MRFQPWTLRQLAGSRCLPNTRQLAERTLDAGAGRLRKQAAAVSMSLAALLGFGLGLAAPTASAQSTTPYAWKNVQIQGGGLVSGVVYHPARKNLVYARTDVGGIYRWVPATQTWLALNDDLGRDDAQLTGVLSLALDYNNADRVYLAAGQYLQSWGRNAAILRSSNRGASWTRTELPFRLGGNADGRGAGERLVVDPNLGSVLFLGTNENGLWKSVDSGVTWSQVNAFAPASVTFVLFHRTSGSVGNATPTLYAGVNAASGPTLYRSTNGGATWAAVPGAPTGLIPNHADFDKAGTLYLSYANALGPNGMSSGQLWKLAPSSNTWTAISPRQSSSSDTFGYGAIAVIPSLAGNLYAATNNRWAMGDELWRSTDGGSSWTLVNAIDSYSAPSSPWSIHPSGEANFRPHWIVDVDIDPFNRNNVSFVTGAGLWTSANAFGTSVNWTFSNAGLEETVPLELVSPPSGAPLLTALGDIGGFRHDDLDSSPPLSGYFNPTGSTNTSIAFAEWWPPTVVRANWSDNRGAYSTDGGSSWVPFPSRPATAVSNGPGAIAVTADGQKLVWIPDNSVAYYSTNMGASWSPSSGSPTGWFRPVADRASASKVYIYDSNAGRIHRSLDGGASFAAAATVPGGGGRLHAVPGYEGHLWLPAGASGLRRSTDSGASFSALKGVDAAWAIGFGKAAAGASYPPLYLWGKFGGVEGIYRSSDTGVSWTRINTDTQRWGWINDISGDPRTYGRVYIATGGRGVLYGTPKP